ncbi:MAG: hypothetical protein ABSB96_00975 [Gaiellaceae bacterium]
MNLNELHLVINRRRVAAVNDQVVDISGISGLEFDPGHARKLVQQLQGVKPGESVLVVVA